MKDRPKTKSKLEKAHEKKVKRYFDRVFRGKRGRGPKPKK